VISIVRQLSRVGRLGLVLVLGLSLAAIGSLLLDSARQGVATQRSQVASGPTTPPAAPTPFNEQAAIAARSSSQPARVPTRFKAGTPTEVLAGLQKNPDWELLMASLVSGPEKDPRAAGRQPLVGQPVFVRGLESNGNDEWILPLQVGSNTIALVWVSIERNQSGSAYVGGMASWDGAFPKINEAQARTKAAAPNDPVVTAELAWAYLKGAADRFQPFWRIVRLSGAVLFLFDSGTVAPASNYLIN
jgi:hypothetical protein